MSNIALRERTALLVANDRADRTRIQAATTHAISTGTYDSELYQWLTGGQAAAGIAVNERTAMCVGAVYASVSLIAGAIASLPLHIYQRTEIGRDRVDVTRNTLAANLWWMLNEQPCTAYAAAVFWEYMLWAELLHGDAFAWIERNGPQPEALHALHPDCVQVNRLQEIDQLVYTFPDVRTGTLHTVTQDDMLHIPGIGFDGRRGMSRLRYAGKTSIGIALAADEYQARFFTNGARPDFALTMDGKLDPEQVKILRDTWMQRYGGPRNAHLPAVLTGGLKVEPLNMTAEDAQLIATRQFQVIDIARIFGVPPHMIGESEKTSSWGSGVEAMSINFVKYTLQRHLTKIEQEINRKLFPRTTRWFAEFSVDGLQRGDSAARSTFYKNALGGAGSPGYMTPNEIRRMENLPPIDGGDQLTTGMRDASATQAAGQQSQ